MWCVWSPLFILYLQNLLTPKCKFSGKSVQMEFCPKHRHKGYSVAHMWEKILNKRMELAGFVEIVELGGFVPSTSYYHPLVQFYFNKHTDVKGVKALILCNEIKNIKNGVERFLARQWQTCWVLNSNLYSVILYQKPPFNIPYSTKIHLSPRRLKRIKQLITPTANNCPGV